MSEERHHTAEITQQAILFNSDGEVLMLKYADDTRKWTFPGGRLHPDESPEEGIRREVHEETGMDVDVLLPIYTTAFSYGGTDKFGVAYLCETDRDGVEISEEHQDWQWIRPDDVTEDHTVSSDHLEALETALQVREAYQDHDPA